jgi:single-strand DNA-binding protein
MASSLNKVMLIGNLGADPEMRKTQSGDPVVNLRIATSETWRDKRDGEKQEKTEWHRVVVWNEAACKFAEEYLAKGDKVYVEGKIETKKWQDKDGKDQYSTEIVVAKFGGVLTGLITKGGDDRGSRRDDDRGSSRRSREDDRGERSERSERSSRSRDDDRSSRRSADTPRDDERSSRRREPAGKRADLDDEIPF